MAKKRLHPKVSVTWKDSQSTDDWEFLDDIPFESLPVIETQGFLIYEDKEQIYVAQNLSKDFAVRMVMQIPKACIIKIKKYS